MTLTILLRFPDNAIWHTATHFAWYLSHVAHTTVLTFPVKKIKCWVLFLITFTQVNRCETDVFSSLRSDKLIDVKPMSFPHYIQTS